MTIRGIRNALVVLPEGVIEGGIVFEDGRIAMVGTQWIGPSDEVIDAGGRLVIPGLVDAQVHLGVSDRAVSDLESESRAAVSSGVTTWNLVQTALTLSDDSWPGAPAAIPFVEVVPGFLKSAEPLSLCDFTLTPILTSAIHTTEVRTLAQTWGITTFAIQMSMRRGWQPADWSPFVNRGHDAFDDSLVFAALREVGRLGRQALVSMHCENVEIRRVQTTASAPPRPDQDAGVREAMDVRTYAYLASRLGCPILIQNAMDADTFATVGRAKQHGIEVFAQSATFKLVDPLQESQRNAWAVLSEPGVDLVTSLHVGIPGTANLAQLHTDPENDGWLATLPMRVQMHLPFLLSGVNAGQLSISRLCQLVCTNPATILGMFPQKGAIRVGADADLVIVDLDLVRRVDQRVGGGHLSNVLRSHELKGWPLVTLVRGEVAAEWSEKTCWNPAAGCGRYVSREPVEPGNRSRIAQASADNPFA